MPSLPVSLTASFLWTLVLAAPVPTSSNSITPAAGGGEPLVILSTTDIKGKTGPCGCHIPKGGLARLAGFADSMRIAHRRLVLVDNGGYFGEDDAHRAQSAFWMDGFKLLSVSAVGVGERDLRFGLAYLQSQAKRTGIPIVCANLNERKTHKAVFPASTVQNVDGVRVGVFGLIGNDIDLGPAKDSLEVGDVTQAATAAIKELKSRGATVIVLLSQLGKTGTEDLVTAIDGIDATVVGHNTPSSQTGRMVKNTMALFGSEQSQYAGRMVLDLDAKGRMTFATGELVALGPDVSSNPAMAELVRHFEEDWNAAQAAQAHVEPVITEPAIADTVTKAAGR